MQDREVLIADLRESREHMLALLQTKLETMAKQVKELSSRIVGELQTVLPPDPEVLLPLASIAERIGDLVTPAAPPATLRLETFRRLDAGRAQSEILQELLSQLNPWCGERAIVVFRDGQVAGWAGAGFASGDPARTWRGAVVDSPALSRTAEGVPVLIRSDADKILSTWFPGSRRMLLVPMSLRGKIVGTLVAVEGNAPLDTVLVQSLTFVTGLVLESMAVRTTVPTPALREPEELSSGAPAPSPQRQPTSFAPAPALTATEESTALAAGIPEGVDAGSTVHLKIPPQAVAQPRSPDDERRHEEARRFARLLVSEIRLYNEQAVQEGKQSHDIYHRLKEDIDRSQEMYEQRVPAEVRATSNYFFEELVRILADGDPDALGL